MNLRNRIAVIGIALVGFVFASQLLAQGNRHGHNPWPENLETITIEGVISAADTLVNNIHYYLDTDTDGIGDYILAFGPIWYTPDTGATRPEIGDQVTIVGRLTPSQPLSVVVVFEINGLEWRPAVEHRWEDCIWPDLLEVVIVTGTVLLDDTYFYPHYYLDVDDDGNADYALSFGPHYYEPESGAMRPEEGVEVTIEGGLRDNTTPPRIIVYSIDGLKWRDPQGPPPWSGRWVRKQNQDPTRIYCPTDSLSWFDIPPGALYGQGQGQRGFPNSIFCEFRRIFPDSMPNPSDLLRAGFHFRFVDEKGKGLHEHRHLVRFFKAIRLRLHWPDEDSDGLMKSLNSGLVIKYWNDDEQTWINLQNTQTLTDGKTVVAELESVGGYFGLFAEESSTSVPEAVESTVPNTIALEQNHPNPFNPSTEIVYSLSGQSPTLVTLTVYDILGQPVRTLVSGIQNPGTHQAFWDGRDDGGQPLPSGTYFYRLKVGGQVLTRTMALLK